MVYVTCSTASTAMPSKPAPPEREGAREAPRVGRVEVELRAPVEVVVAAEGGEGLPLLGGEDDEPLPTHQLRTGRRGGAQCARVEGEGRRGVAWGDVG